jgi:hypothetical protein
VKRLLLLVAVTCVFVADVCAQEQPVVRVSVSPETVNVGEPAKLRVAVLVPTWFTRPPIYPGFELSNAITRLPPDSSFPISERIGNETWAGIVRDYRVYPLLGASYRISEQVITVTYANPGSSPVTVDVDVPDIQFRGQVPTGAEQLNPYLAGRRLTLSRDIDGDLSELEAGDALVIRYTAELDGLPAIFLPPLAPDLQFDGVSVYADAPKVEDDAVARRSEKLTLVFDAGGEFSVPDFELSFWNTASGSIETAFVPGLSIAVDGPPAIPPETDVATERRWPSIVGLLAIVFVMLFVLRRWGPTLARYYREAAKRRRQTERHAFTQLENAIASKRPETAYRALLAWLDRLQPGMDARSFARAYGDASLLAAIDALSAGIYNDAAKRIDMRSLRAGLAGARERLLQQRSPLGRPSLPPLNP